MPKTIKYAFIALTQLALTACAMQTVTDIFVAEKDDYLKANTVNALEIPEDLDGSNIQDEWTIPAIPDQPAARVYPQGAPKPITIVGENDPTTIRIKKLGDRRWMVLQRNPDTVWPLVRQFLTYYGLEVAAESPDDGQITTGPIEYSSPNYVPEFQEILGPTQPLMTDGDYLVFRIEQGIRRGTSEIHMRYLKPDQQLNPEMWITGSPETGDLEGLLLTAIAEFDVSAVSESTFSSVARQIVTQPKAAVLRDDEGHPILMINIDFDRAWASISKALEDASVEITDTQRESQSFSILMPTLDAESQTKRRGFMGFMFGGGNSNADGSRAAIVHITALESGFAVSVLRPDGTNIDVGYAEQFLAMLREHAA